MRPIHPGASEPGLTGAPLQFRLCPWASSSVACCCAQRLSKVYCIIARDQEAREGLVDRVAKAAKAYADVEESSAMAVPALDQADVDLAAAQKAFDESDPARKAADALAVLRRADFDCYNNKLHLDQLKERKERVDQIRENAARAEALLARNKVDASALKAIQDAERGLLTASAQLQTGAPSVLLRGLADCRLSIDDAEVKLGKGEIRTISVADRSRLTIPGALDVEIKAGSSAEGLSIKVEEARALLDKACVQSGGVHSRRGAEGP